MEEEPCIADMVKNGHRNEVVMRDLAAQYRTKLEGERCKFIICPAFFDEKNNISVCEPSYVSDWVYKKTAIAPNIVYTPLKFSQYQKVTLSGVQQIDPAAVFYIIKENERVVDSYSLDQAILDSGGYLYVRKNQRLEVRIHTQFSHLYEFEGE